MVTITENLGDGSVHVEGKPFDVCFNCFLIALRAIHTFDQTSDSKEFTDLMLSIVGKYLENPKQNISEFLDDMNPIIDKINEYLETKGGDGE